MKQRRQEDIIMRGNINPQHVIELRKKQQQQHYKQKEKSISLNFDPRPEIKWT
jgi:hypothetical protein